MADAGVENVNAQVDELITAGVLRRVLAFTELGVLELHGGVRSNTSGCSSSLDSVTTVRRLVEFYVQQHNRVLPHSAFRGQTPDEGIARDRGCDSTRRRCARPPLVGPAKANRSAACGMCPSTDAAA